MSLKKIIANNTPFQIACKSPYLAPSSTLNWPISVFEENTKMIPGSETQSPGVYLVKHDYQHPPKTDIHVKLSQDGKWYNGNKLVTGSFKFITKTDWSDYGNMYLIPEKEVFDETPVGHMSLAIKVGARCETTGEPKVGLGGEVLFVRGILVENANNSAHFAPPAVDLKKIASAGFDNIWGIPLETFVDARGFYGHSADTAKKIAVLLDNLESLFNALDTAKKPDQWSKRGIYFFANQIIKSGQLESVFDLSKSSSRKLIIAFITSFYNHEQNSYSVSKQGLSRENILTLADTYAKRRS